MEKVAQGFELKLDDISLPVEVAADEKSRKKGLSKRKITDTTSMLFVFPKEGKHQMWMKDTEADLDMLFMDSKGKVTHVITAEKGNKDLIGEREDTKYVLEMPAGYAEKYDIIQGDSLDIPEEFADTDEDEPHSMTLLDDEGNPQMELKGGERIFSRKKTKEMIEKAMTGKSMEELRELGRIVAEEVVAQDKRGPEYVEAKEDVVYAKNGTKLNIIPTFEELGGMDITDVRAVLGKYGYKVERMS